MVESQKGCWVKEPKKKKKIVRYFMVLFMWLFWAKLSYGDRNQKSGCLWEQEGLTEKGHWGGKDVLHLDWGSGNSRLHLSKLKWICILFYANYPSNKENGMSPSHTAFYFLFPRKSCDYTKPNLDKLRQTNSFDDPLSAGEYSYQVSWIHCLRATRMRI